MTEWPEQFVLREEFITADEEANLLKHIATPRDRKRHNCRNRADRYGDAGPYGNSPRPIPDYIQRLGVGKFRDIVVSQYFEGQGISAHIDVPKCGEVIVILSLGSVATMRFRKDKESFDVDLPPRSLFTMSGELRWKWTHEILPVKAERYSIVFRCSE